MRALDPLSNPVRRAEWPSLRLLLVHDERAAAVLEREELLEPGAISCMDHVSGLYGLSYLP